MRFRHTALFVGIDLRDAERYYADLFGFEVVVREGPLEAGGPDAGRWAQLPLDKDWEDADAAGVYIGMVALQRDDVIIALFAAEPSGDRMYAIGLVAEQSEIDDLAGRLTDEMIEGRGAGWLAFVDRYGVRWQLSTSGPFAGAGSHGHWLDV